MKIVWLTLISLLGVFVTACVIFGMHSTGLPSVLDGIVDELADNPRADLTRCRANFSGSLLGRFPLGAPAIEMTDELKAEGFREREHSVEGGSLSYATLFGKYRYVGFAAHWKADSEGRLSAVWGNCSPAVS